MSKQFPCKAQVLSSKPEHQKEVKVIGRIIRIVPEGITIEVDPKYLTQALEKLGMSDCKPVSSPAIKEDNLDGEGRKALLLRRLLEEKVSMTEKDPQAEEEVMMKNACIPSLCCASVITK